MSTYPSPSRSSKSVYIGLNNVRSFDAANITIGRFAVMATFGGIASRGLETSIGAENTTKVQSEPKLAANTLKNLKYFKIHLY